MRRREPSVHLEHHPRLGANRDRPEREGLGVWMDADDPPVTRDEDHVEADRRILHPEGMILLGVEEEHHPVVWVEMIAVHEAARLSVRGVGDLDEHDGGGAVLWGQHDRGATVAAGAERE